MTRKRSTSGVLWTAHELEEFLVTQRRGKPILFLLSSVLSLRSETQQKIRYTTDDSGLHFYFSRRTHTLRITVESDERLTVLYDNGLSIKLSTKMTYEQTDAALKRFFTNEERRDEIPQDAIPHEGASTE